MLQKMNEDGRLLKSLKFVCGSDSGRKRFCAVLCQLLEQPEQTISVIRKAIRHVMPYDEYLKTEHWKKLSSAAKYAANGRCQLCNGTGELHAHHRTYDRRGFEFDGDITVLCAECHGKFHDKVTA